jgi:hypothetical protein
MRARLIRQSTPLVVEPLFNARYEVLIGCVREMTLP